MEKTAFNFGAIPAFFSKMSTSPKFNNYVKTRLGQTLGGAANTALPTALAGGTLNTIRGMVFDKTDPKATFMDRVGKGIGDFTTGALLTAPIGAIPGAIRAHNAFSGLRGRAKSISKGIKSFEQGLNSGKYTKELSTYADPERIKDIVLKDISENKANLHKAYNDTFQSGFSEGFKKGLGVYGENGFFNTDKWQSGKMPLGTVFDKMNNPYWDSVYDHIKKGRVKTPAPVKTSSYRNTEKTAGTLQNAVRAHSLEGLKNFIMGGSKSSIPFVAGGALLGGIGGAGKTYVMSRINGTDPTTSDYIKDSLIGAGLGGLNGYAGGMYLFYDRPKIRKTISRLYDDWKYAPIMDEFVNKVHGVDDYFTSIGLKNPTLKDSVNAAADSIRKIYDEKYQAELGSRLLQKYGDDFDLRGYFSNIFDKLEPSLFEYIEKSGSYNKFLTEKTAELIKNMAEEKIAGALQQTGQAVGGALKYSPIGAGLGLLAGMAYEDLFGNPEHTMGDYISSGIKGGVLGTGIGGLVGAAKTHFKEVPTQIKALQDKIDKLSQPTNAMKTIQKDLDTWEAILRGEKQQKPSLAISKLKELMQWHVSKNEGKVKDLRKQMDVLNNGGFWENVKKFM